MKYIDSEKLVDEIERLMGLLPKEQGISINLDWARNTLVALHQFITSLQQEQPEANLEKEIDRWFEIARDDEGFAHVSSKDGTICDDWKKSDYIMNKPSFYGFARHFYELARQKYEK